MIQNTRIIKPHPGTEPRGAPIEADAWKNIVFLKSGQSWIAETTYDSEAMAQQKADEALARTWSEGPNHLWKTRDGTTFRGRELSHTIAIPWSRA